MKIKEKEAHDLNVKVNNCQDSVKNLKFELSSCKSSKSKLEKDLKNREKRIKKLEIKKELQSVALQTVTVVDIPYEEEKVECSICGLPFDSSTGLNEHDRLYKYCCRTCSTCYSTVEESSCCCVEERIDWARYCKLDCDKLLIDICKIDIIQNKKNYT